MRFCQFAIVPAVANDAMLRRRRARKIVRLRRAGDRRKGWRDAAERTALHKLRNARRVFADERLREAHHVDDSKAFHAAPGYFLPRNSWMASMLSLIHTSPSPRD